MKNLINWISGNKKFLVDFKGYTSEYKDTVTNQIIWCRDVSEIKEMIKLVYKNPVVFDIKYLKIPNFSKAKNYINVDKSNNGL